MYLKGEKVIILHEFFYLKLIYIVVASFSLTAWCLDILLIGIIKRDQGY